MDGAEGSLDLEQIWHILREKAWLIGLFGIIGIFGALTYIHRTPITFYAQAVIQVDAEPVKVVNVETQQTKDPLGDEMGLTLITGLKSRAFAQDVVVRNKLKENPDFLPPLPSGRKRTIEECVGPLMGMSRIGIRPATRFIDLGIQHPNPQMAKDLANMMATTFVQQTIEQRAATTKMKVTYLKDEAQKQAEKLRESEQNLDDYMVKKNSISLKEQQDTIVTELKSQTGQLGTARATRMRLETDDDEIKRQANNPDALLKIPSVANHQTIAASLQQIAALESKIVTAKLRWTEKHPGMIALRTQLADARQTLRDNVLKIPPVIHSAYQSALENERKFQKALESQTQVAMDLNKQRIEYNVLSRDVETNRAMYDGLLKNLMETMLVSGVDLTNVHIFEHALAPVEPVQARKSRILAIGTGASLLLGLGLSLGLHFLDSSVKTVDQAERIYGLTVLAAVPRRLRNRLKDSSFSLVKEPESPVAEAFRSLRTALYLAGRNKGRKIILFTSAMAGEGKTFCSINYATALAQQGKKTLIIDADLRVPMVASIMLQDKETPGLGELLSKPGEGNRICRSEIENLWILPAGGTVQNPAELLANPNFGTLLKQLALEYDRIVIDTAPVTAVSDTLLLVEYAEAVCLVTRAGKTPRKWVLRGIKLLTEAGARPTGMVLNQIPLNMAGAYSYYAGSYGEPGVYGSNDTRKRVGEKGEPATEPLPRT